MQNNLSRRTILAGATASAALIAARPALALTTGEAQSLIQTVINDIFAAINRGGSESQLFAAFERIFSRYADVPTIARSTLGASARTATSAQLNAFANAFQTYVSRKYGRRFREFVGGTITVQGTRAVKSFYEVRAIADLPAEAPFEVIFLVSDRSGRNLFFDLLIEGISLLKTERTEIGALLDRRRGDLDALIRDLPGLA